MTLIDDSAQEDSETVVLTLAAGSGYGLVSPDKHTLTIVDDDRPLTAFFASASQSADEGSGTRDVEVRLNKATASDITLAYTVTGTATSGSDYTALSGTVTVPARATTATIPVALIDNSVPESSETVVLKLTAGSGYAVSSSGTHTLTIVDDEPTISFASASQSAGEGSGTHDVGVTPEPGPALGHHARLHGDRHGDLRLGLYGALRHGDGARARDNGDHPGDDRRRCRVRGQ